MYGDFSDIFVIFFIIDLFIFGIKLVGNLFCVLLERLRYLVLFGNNIVGEMLKKNFLSILNFVNN